MIIILVLLFISFKLTAAIPKDLGLIEITTANSPLAYVSPYDTISSEVCFAMFVDGVW